MIAPLLRKVDSSLLGKQIERCNSRFFYDFKVRQARDIIKDTFVIFSGNLPVAVSGGKDSLVVLHIALEANPDVSVIYNNTTVEFPETLQYMRRLQKEWGFTLHITQSDKPFFKAVKDRGWATHENRWCCKPYKDLPAFQFLSSRGYKAEITGTTRTESIYRRSLTPIKTPKKEPYIIRVNPIYDWNEWEVWRYIKENDLPYNPLYDLGYRRIGCWCCPINGPTHYKRLRKTHPHLFKFLSSFSPPHPIASKI
ncbi:phosphoadenosine phosphosulfate reductase family protein [Candidatus Bathyarchaeota archaeon A05DMB-2]|nr:phosphoadenosine phosphosulfate reductase family protein [Candidatus Bathyarchaeota archaeon A05DMB-2]